MGVCSLLAACILSGCCCLGSTGPSMPVSGVYPPYSDGNPYGWHDDFWGVGYYCHEFGFLRRADTCP